jgi:hypothetical protein
LQWNEDDGPVPNRTEEELLGLTRQKAAAIGARRRWQVGAAMTSAVVVIVGLVAVVAAGGSGGTGSQTVSGGPGATKPLVTSTTLAVAATPPPESTPLLPLVSLVPPSGGTTVPGTPDDSGPADGPEVPAADTVPAGCHNSFDPACGPFRWDPPPGPNQPLTVSMSTSPTAPKVGDVVTFDVTVDDPDGAELLDRSERTINYGDTDPSGEIGGHVDCVGGSGPWTTPAPVPLHEHLVFQHAYTSTGTYTVTARYHSFGNCAYPTSAGMATTTVVVS